MQSLETYTKSKYSSTSSSGYLGMIKRFQLALGDSAAQATQQQVLQYIQLLRTQKLQARTLKNNLFAIKIYFHYLLDTNQREDHPCRYLNLKDKVDRQIKVEELYPMQVLETFYQSYQSRIPRNEKRDQVMISLLIYQALTVLEISQLKVWNIDLEKGRVSIKANKKNRARTLPLKPQQILLFHRHIEERKLAKESYLVMGEKGESICSSLIVTIINHGRKKEERLLPLKIRQSVIAHLLKEKNDVRIVQEFAGHRRTSSTEAYLQSGLEELKSAIEKLHPMQ